MRARTWSPLSAAVTAVLFASASASAQDGLLVGTVTDAASGAGISSATVQVEGEDASRTLVTNSQGGFQAELPAGSYAISATVLGYGVETVEAVAVTAGSTTNRDVQLARTALALDEIEVEVASRVVESPLEAPAVVSVVPEVRIQNRVTLSPAEHLEDVAGVDIVPYGIQGGNVVTRGFNNIFSGSLQMLTDRRLAKVPSLNVNLMHFIPAVDLDIERIETALGPGAALYGPNSANGVVHISTKSPLDQQGTTVSITGGERSIFQGAFRSAVLLGERVGLKVSGQYVQGDDWERLDPNEQAARETTDANLGACIADRQVRGLSAAGAEAACLRLGVRDFDTERFGFEARADLRIGEDGALIGTYGRTDATGIELTGLGAAQTRNWVYQFYQARLEMDDLFAQLYYNTADSGNSYLLLEGTPLTDESGLLVGQVQHGFDVFDERQRFTYGVDYIGTRPESSGSIYGAYEDVDDMDEWGAFLQSRTAITPQLDLTLAGRIDSHSALEDNVWSPRAALVFRPVPTHSLRLAYNQAYSAPTALNLFLDVSGGFAPDPLGSLGYSSRAFGTGENGFSLQNPDGSLGGVRSPLNPGGASQLLPAHPAALWPLAVGALQAQDRISGDLADLMNSLTPTSEDIALALLDPSSQVVSPLVAGAVPDVPQLRESSTETIELGWTGIFPSGLSVTTGVYYMERKDFTSPLQLQTPLVLLSGQDVGAFIAGPVGNAIAQELIGQGVDPGQAAQIAETQVTELATGIGSLPLGVVSSDQVSAQGADLILTYRNAGDVELWGADIAVEAPLTPLWTVSGTYSFMSKDYFQDTGGAPIALNAPKHKGSVGLAYQDAARGLNASTRVRFTGSFPAESAGYVGTRCVTGETGGIFDEDCVDSSAIVDLTMGYRVPNTRATVQLSVSNLFNTGYRSFVGVPVIGRLAMLRFKYDLF